MKHQNNKNLVTSSIKTILLSLFFISGLVFYGTAGANQNTAAAAGEPPNDTIFTSMQSIKNYINNLIFFEIDEANPNKTDRFGKTLLHRAVSENNLETITKLLKAGANPNALDRDDRTPLHYAAWSRQDLKTVTTLLKAGANPNAANRFGDTPLHYAAQSPGNLEMVIALLKAGANPNQWNKQDKTPLYYAQLNEDTKIATALLEAGANP